MSSKKLQCNYHTNTKPPADSKCCKTCDFCDDFDKKCEKHGFKISVWSKCDDYKNDVVEFFNSDFFYE